MTSSSGCKYPCSTFCLSNSYLGHPSQLPVTRMILFNLCNHCVPKYPDANQLVQPSCKARATHTTCLPQSQAPTLTACGCDPPSLSLFLNSKTSITQLVTRQACQPRRRIPGSHLHAFARRGKSRRRCVSCERCREVEGKYWSEDLQYVASCRLVTSHWLRGVPKDFAVKESQV
jgi:hypothetical protein